MTPTPIPERFKQAIDRYVQSGIIPGGFLHAVLVNDLTMAVIRADDESIQVLPDIVMYLYWECPANCWGSTRKVSEWRGLSARGRRTVHMDEELPV